MVTLADLQAAQRVVSKIALRTPILPVKFSDRPETYVKCENLQRTGAFKIRGALNRISKLPDSCRGVTASSSGNHAQAVALAARLRGLKASIVMLDQSVPHKIEGTKSYGAEVILGGTTSVAIKERAERIAAERGYVYIPPFNDPDIIAGQGTVGLEILEDLRDVKSVVVPIGGGGLLSGIATAIKETRPSIKVFGVEPAGAAKMLPSLRAGKIVTLEKVETIADGLKPTRVESLTFEAVGKYVDEVVTVTDEEILEAMRHLALKEKLVVEPSGAASLAAIRAGRLRLPEGPAVAILSGGNADLRLVVGS
ncbi:MAG TPA: threonine/serine dehydratase [Planctomycetota bacterium]|nr:threonine/serine dehydratase [Planctomycetota bacterium]